MEDELKPFVPLYYKEIMIPESPGAAPEPYLEIQDLLGNFQNPSVMDVKMVCICNNNNNKKNNNNNNNKKKKKKNRADRLEIK